MSLETDDSDPLKLLIIETATGDRDAFRLLYEKSSAKLFGTLIRILKREELARDVLQEVYISIWQRASSFDPEHGRAMSWMIAIARNRAIDVLRRADERAVTYSIDDDMQGAALAVLDEKLSEQRSSMEPSERMTLEYCLSEIEPKSRECVLLAYQYGYSRDELASKYDVPSGTVKSWLRRALGKLKECLER